MKKIIGFLCMSFLFSVTLHAMEKRDIKSVNKEIKKLISKKVINAKRPLNAPQCVTTQIPGGYYYACTAAGTCQSTWTSVSACINNSDGTCTTLSMVYVQ